MLEIPHLGAVQRRLRLCRPSPVAARTALALLEDGQLQPDATGAVTDLLRNGFRTWLDRHTAGMRTIDIKLWYTEDRQRTAADIALGTDLPHPLYVGHRLTALQRQIPGLGETVLWHLDHDLPGQLEIFTPSETLCTAQYMEWGGCDDEQEVVQQYLADGEDPKDIEVLTRAQFDRTLPAWATEPGERIKPPRLKKIAAGRGLAARVATAVLGLIEVRGHHEASEDGCRLWPPVQVLCWGPSDRVTLRLADSLGNMLSECGEYIENFAETSIDNSPYDSGRLHAFMRDAEKPLRALRAADRILQLIGSKSA